jgi:hypothetical protein
MNRTKQLISGLHRAKRVGSTLSILLLVIYMMRLGFSFSIVRLVGGYLLIVVSLSNILSFPHPIFLSLLSTPRHSLFTSHISPSCLYFPFRTIPKITIIKTILLWTIVKVPRPDHPPSPTNVELTPRNPRYRHFPLATPNSPNRKTSKKSIRNRTNDPTSRTKIKGRL